MAMDRHIELETVLAAGMTPPADVEAHKAAMEGSSSGATVSLVEASLARWEAVERKHGSRFHRVGDRVRQAALDLWYGSRTARMRDAVGISAAASTPTILLGCAAIAGLAYFGPTILRRAWRSPAFSRPLSGIEAVQSPETRLALGPLVATPSALFGCTVIPWLEELGKRKLGWGFTIPLIAAEAIPLMIGTYIAGGGPADLALALISRAALHIGLAALPMNVGVALHAAFNIAVHLKLGGLAIDPLGARQAESIFQRLASETRHFRTWLEESASRTRKSAIPEIQLVCVPAEPPSSGLPSLGQSPQ